MKLQLKSLSKKEYNRPGKTSPGTLTITKELDKATPKLAEKLSSGDAFEEMTIADGDKNYLLKNVTVVSVQKKGGQEVVTLRFAHREEFGQVQRAAAANHNTTRSNRTQPVADSATATNPIVAIEVSLTCRCPSPNRRST